MVQQNPAKSVPTHAIDDRPTENIALSTCGAHPPARSKPPPDHALEAADILRSSRSAHGRRGLVVLLSGLSGSGKSTLAHGLIQQIEEHTHRSVSLLDGDDMRRTLSAGLGFDRASRDTNVLRIGWVAAQIAKHGGVAICAVIAPYAATRAQLRTMAQEFGDFVLVHVATSLAECEHRDIKGLYAQARAGELREFTGVSDPYETPIDADVVVDTALRSRVEGLDEILQFLVKNNLLPESVRNNFITAISHSPGNSIRLIYRT